MKKVLSIKHVFHIQITIIIDIDTVGFTIGFSQLLYTISEGDGSVRVCAELMSGEIPVKLGVVSISVMANLAKSSGNRHSNQTVCYL